MQFKRVSKTTLVLLTIIGLLTTALAVVYYTKTVPMTFNVSTEYGLVLYNEAKTQVVNSIDWGSFNTGESKSINYYLKNTSNKDANVTCYLSAYDTDAWLITHDFDNQTIVKDGFSAMFTVTIQELDAVSNGGYTCDLKFDIVQNFSEPLPSTIEYGSTQVSYEAATATYLVLVDSGFSKTSYNLGESATFWYRTQNIKPSDTLVAFQDRIELLKDGSLNSILQGNTTHTVNLAPLAMANLSVTFNSPLVAGDYAIRVCYCLADSVPISISTHTDIVWNVVGDLIVLRISTPVASPYEYTTGNINVGSEFYSDVMKMTASATRNIKLVSVSKPIGYSLYVRFDWNIKPDVASMSYEWNINQENPVNTSNPLWWGFHITNTSGLVANQEFTIVFSVT